MKKIFRMATVVALACASLTYTSCTKDYSEEINDLNTDLSSLQSKHDADIAKLEGEISALKSAITSLETASKGIEANAAEIAALKTKLADSETAVNQLKAAVAALQEASPVLEAKIGAVASDLAACKEELLAKTAELEAKLNAVEVKTAEIEAALAAIQDVYAALANTLTSVVFMPDFYYGGIEATAYTYATINAQKYVVADKEGKDITVDGTKMLVAAGQPLSTDALMLDILDKDGKPTGKKEAKVYTLGECGVATYSINPSSFDVDSAEWSLVGADYDYVPVAKADGATWAPKFESIKMVDGVAKVSYHIEGAQNLSANSVSLMNLVATLEDGKTVTSDAAAVLSENATVDALAFVKAAEDHNPHLYATLEEALNADAMLEVVYSAGDVDLAKMITVHTNATEAGDVEMTLAQLNEKYGDQFTMTFDNIEYTVGANKTAESMYAGITKAGVYTPMYVKSGADATSVPCSATEGVSSIGRHPVVLVTLWNGEEVVLAGFFKVEVVAAPSVKPEDPKQNDIIISMPSFDKLALVCEAAELSTNWHNFSDYVLEALNVPYADFDAKYKVDTNNVYVKSVDEKTGAVTYVASSDFGTIKYNKDANTDGVNDVFVWTVEPKAIGAGKTQTVYVHFDVVGNDHEDVYVALTVSVADPAHFVFGQKIANEWYSDMVHCATNEPNTVISNVKVPAATNDDVTVYARDLNSFLVGGKASVVLAADSDPIYANADLEAAVEYVFSAEQPVIAGAQLIVDETGKKISVASEAVVEGKKVLVFDEKKLVASLTGTTITYATSDTAKELLNLWGMEETEAEKMLYANVNVALSYGSECNFPAGEDHFHVRFVRPLTVSFAAQDVAEESAVAGANVSVAKFISGIKDWNKQSVLNEVAATNDTPAYLEEAVISGVNMYKYYKFTSMVVDLKNAVRDNWNTSNPAEFKNLLDVTPNAKLTLKSTGPIAKSDANTIDMTDFASLEEMVINYQNSEAVVKAFTIKVPVAINYAWGTIKSELVINVKATSETSGK